MFSFNKPGKGNPDLTFKSAPAGYGASNTAPFTKPTQGQIGAGGDMQTAMLMQMLGGMGDKKAPETQMNGGGIDYQGPQMEGFQTQRDPIQEAYKQAIMSALMTRGGV